MEERKIVYWGGPEEERLQYSDKEDVIEAILEDFDELPETIEVCGYARMNINLGGAYGPLERILESLDEEYGDPDGDGSEPTEAMKEAEKAFMAVIAQEYEPWACEEIARETVNVTDWIKAHHAVDEMLKRERGEE